MFQSFRHLLILLQAALLLPPLPACCCTWTALTGSGSVESAESSSESAAPGCCQKTLKSEELADVLPLPLPLTCCTQRTSKPEALPTSSCECCVDHDSLPVRDRVQVFEGIAVPGILLTAGCQPVIASEVLLSRYSTTPMWTGPPRHVLHCVWRC